MINRFIASLIALILVSAALLKWVYPPARNPLFFGLVGGVEAVLALALLTYARSWRVWLILVLIVSIWMGFSFYVTLFGLPCSCMGGSLILPRGISFALNGLMLVGAVIVLHRSPIKLKQLIPFFILMFIFGFVTSIIYYNYQT